MCGIYCSLSTDQYVMPTDEELELLKRRGPDSCHTIHRQIEDEHNGAPLCLTFCATVLALRGNQITEQPLKDPSSQSIFCWNGEAWQYERSDVDGNDAQLVFNLLSRISADTSVPSNMLPRKITAALGSISGPFAFVYFDARHLQLFFGRDVLGRRSLLKAMPGDGSQLISSVSSKSFVSDWTEVKADGIYAIDIKQMLKPNRSRDYSVGGGKAPYGIQHIPWYEHKRDDVSGASLVRCVLCTFLVPALTVGREATRFCGI